MTRSLDALYARHGIEASGPVDTRPAPAQALLDRAYADALERRPVGRMGCIK